MTNRENFFAAMSGKPYDRVLLDMQLCDQLQKKLREERGVTDYADYYGVPFRRIGPKPSKNPADYSRYYEGKDVDYIGEWGDGHKYGGTEHFTRFIPCMEHFGTPEEVYAFPLPDLLEDYRWEGVAEEIARCKGNDQIVLSGLVGDVFEPAWYLRGMEELLTDFYTDQAMAEACLDRIFRFKLEMVRKQVSAGVDVMIFGDDVGMQTGMMMSPDIWRTFLKPRLKELLAAAKKENPGVLCYYHSDGDIRAIIPELIEIGVDILNPIQPECMDPKEIYRRYVEQVRFWGCVGTQSTLPFGTADEVRARTGELLELCRERGRLVLAPTHLVEPEVPLENLDAMVETIRNFR